MRSHLKAARSRAQALMYQRGVRVAEAELKKAWSKDAATRHVSRIGRIACALGWHHVLDWIYHSQNSCDHMGICLRCGAKRSQVAEHQFELEREGWFKEVAPKI